MPPGSRFFLPNGVHCSPDLGSGEELPFPQSQQPSGALAGLGLAPAGTSLRSPLIESFLLLQTPSCFSAGPRIYTGLLVLPEPWCYIYPSPLSWKCSLLPVKGSRMSPQMLCPMSESLSGKREGFQDNATGKKGKFIAAVHPMQRYGVRVLSPSCYPIYKECISSW